MRVALIVPPQWDPRQPTLAMPTLAGFLRRAGAEARIFDLNLALYLRLLGAAGGVGETLAAGLRDPARLEDAAAWGRLQRAAESLFGERFDPAGGAWLGFDRLAQRHSPNRGRDWQEALSRPHSVPSLRHLAVELAAVTAYAPDLVAIGGLGDSQLIDGLALAGALRQRLGTAVRVVVGGQAWRARRMLLGRAPWLFDVLDLICVGDGEPFFAALLAGATAAEIPNAAWRDGGTVRVRSPLTPHRFTPADVADWRGLDPARYLSPMPVLPVETARGCPWSRCRFCNRPDHALPLAERYQIRPAGSVVAELTAAAAAGVSRFAFVDEAIDPAGFDRLFAILTAVSARNDSFPRCDRAVVAAGGSCRGQDEPAVAVPASRRPAIGAAERVADPATLHGSLPVGVEATGSGASGAWSWLCYARPDPAIGLARWRRARAMGLCKVFVGFETGSDRLLTAYDKGTTAAGIARALGDLGRAGVGVHLFIMTGFPGEVAADRAATADLLTATLPGLDPFAFSYDLFPVFAERGTPLGDDPDAFGKVGGTGPGRSGDGGQNRDFEFRICAGERPVGRQAGGCRAPIATMGGMSRSRAAGAVAPPATPVPAAPSAPEGPARSLQETLPPLIEHLLGATPGLRHLALGQDASHLLLLEARGNPRSR